MFRKKKKIRDSRLSNWSNNWVDNAGVPSTGCASHYNVPRNDVQNDRIFLPHISFHREKLPWEGTKWLEPHSQEKICSLIIGEKVQYDRLK